MPPDGAVPRTIRPNSFIGEDALNDAELREGGRPRKRPISGVARASRASRATRACCGRRASRAPRANFRAASAATGVA